jgi:signal transduction histidine kinase
VEPHDLKVRAHPGLLTRLLHVLYENAILASAPRPPRVATLARAVGGRVSIDIADDGPGVPKDIADRVFDPLVTARPGGTGLGLSLARRIAAAHGGSISLVDTQSGATFHLELPGS